MKPSHHPGEINIPADIAAKCDGPNQAERFDRGVRAMFTVSKSAVLKDEAKTKRLKMSKRKDR